ncbi:hypothetical protein ACHAXT_002657 [Thalassiosira profunda]
MVDPGGAIAPLLPMGETVTGPGSVAPKAAVPLDGCGCRDVTNAAATDNPDVMGAAGEDGDSKVGEGRAKRASIDVKDGADHSATADLHQTCDASGAPPSHPRTEMRRPTAPDPMAEMDGSSVDGEEPAVVTDESSASSMGARDDAGEQENDGDARGYEIVVPQCRMSEKDCSVVPPNTSLDDRKDDSLSSGEGGKDGPAPSEDTAVIPCTPDAAVPLNSPTTTLASGDKKAAAPLPPPGHVYALRDIAWPGCNLCSEERAEESCTTIGDGARSQRNNTGNNGHHFLPRIVTSQAVRASEAVHKQLEADTAGTVLCRPDGRGGVGAVHFQAADVSSPLPEEPATEDRERARELSIAAMPASSLIKEMERLLEGQFGTRVRCPFTCDDEEATRPGVGKQVGEKKRRRWRFLPPRLVGSLRHMRNRKDRKKKRSEGRSRHHPPSMVLEAGGVIDWAQSDLEDCRASPGGYSYVVTYTANRNAIASPVGRAVGLGATIFGDRAVMGNRIDPVDEVVPVSASLGVYISESGLNAADCKTIIDVSERCAADRGGWSSYTYAKQTLGCREDDRLAFVCARPVMTACATIRKHLVEEGREAWPSAADNATTTGQGQGGENAATTKAPTELVLDVREPHVVKYDTTRVERGKLDLHTDKSVWTFLIALSEGRGQDYRGGGTYFQALNSVAHLQRGQMLVFRGRLRHSGVKIGAGCRYLLVGFLVPKGGGGTASRVGGGAGGGVKASPAEIRC